MLFPDGLWTICRREPKLSSPFPVVETKPGKVGLPRCCGFLEFWKKEAHIDNSFLDF